ncbi:MAG: radical SAM protein [Clostridia bacterium]|nr:radical SAM protein [Clostridia bacterium]
MKHANVACFVPHLGCPHRCSFCNQIEISGKARVPTPQEAASAAQQALETPGFAGHDAEFAFFGGSFTAIGINAMTALLGAVAPYCGVGAGQFRGIRISTRPDAIDKKILQILSGYPVTSIELGAQSMRDPVLAANGRGHTAADVAAAAALIRAGGFELGLQMMTGLYTDHDEGALETAHALCALGPATVRIYPTLVLRGTELERLYRAGLYRPQTLDEATSLCAGLLELFTARGVRVIRLGLHVTRSLEESFVAGPMHPAFRELCEGRIYYRIARSLLAARSHGGSATLEVSPSAISKLAGQHRCNILALERETGTRILISGCASLKPYEIKLSVEG